MTHSPILRSSAQLLILPVNTEGVVLDPVISRCKNLFPDNYQLYRRQCLEGSLPVGSCLLIKRQREQAGLGSSSNGNQPSHIANLAITDHPYHPTRKRWLTDALLDLQPKLFDLIRYEGIRQVALLTRPLLAPSKLLPSPKPSAVTSQDDGSKVTDGLAHSNNSNKTEDTTPFPLKLELELELELALDSNSDQPLLSSSSPSSSPLRSYDAALHAPVLDWSQDIYPLLVKHLGELPRVRIDVHLPKEVDLS